MKPAPIPPGYHTLTPYLFVRDAAKAIELWKKALGAVELFRMPGDGGKIMHAELKIGDSPLMLTDEMPEMGAKSPQALGGSPIMMHVYVEDVDAFVDKAVKNGMTLKRPVEDQFYGDRAGLIEDGHGFSWYVATHVKDVTPEELQKNAPAGKK